MKLWQFRALTATLDADVDILIRNPAGNFFPAKVQYQPVTCAADKFLDITAPEAIHGSISDRLVLDPCDDPAGQTQLPYYDPDTDRWSSMGSVSV